MNILLFHERREDWLKKNCENLSEEVLKDKSRFLQRDYEQDLIIKILKETNENIILIKSREDLIKILKNINPKETVGWNITDGYDIYDGANFPSLLKMLGIPSVMENTYIQSLAQNKDHFKEVVRGFGVPSPKSVTIYKESPSNIKISFDGPYLIKPSKLDNSIGLLKDKRNIQKTREGAINMALKLAEDYNSPMMIEEYIEGYDISNPYAFINGNLVIAAIRERIDSNWSQFGYQPNELKDLRAKEMVLAKKEDYDEIELLCKLMVTKLGLCRYGRFDFRRSVVDGKIYLLEFNPGTSLTGKQFELFYELNNLTMKEFLIKMIEVASNEKKNNCL